MLIVIAAFLIINGLPGGHEWYEETFVHEGWNRLVEITPIPAEFEMDTHEHGEAELVKNYIPLVLAGLIIVPIIAYFYRKKMEVIQ